MSGVSVLQHFEAYQKARVTFVQAVAEAATRPQNIEVMQNAGVMQLLRPLLLDNVSVSKEISTQQPPPVAQSVLHFCNLRVRNSYVALMFVVPRSTYGDLTGRRHPVEWPQLTVPPSGSYIRVLRHSTHGCLTIDARQRSCTVLKASRIICHVPRTYAPRASRDHLVSTISYRNTPCCT